VDILRSLFDKEFLHYAEIKMLQGDRSGWSSSSMAVWSENKWISAQNM